MSRISPYMLSLLIKGGSKEQIDSVTHDLWVYLCGKIDSLQTDLISFSEFESTVLDRASFLKNVFSKSNPLERLKSVNTLRRAVSDLSKNVELTRMVKHWKEGNRKASKNLRQMANSMFLETDQYLKRQNFQSKNGTAFDLGGLVRRQNVKLGERIAITKAMELDAKEKDMDCLFFTVTCPPEMHPSPKYGENSYNGTHIQEATKFLNKKMTASFKELSKKSISRESGDIFGFRVIEPHDDACPHIHCLLFLKRQHIRTLLEEVIKAFDYNNLFTYKRRLRNDFDEKIGILLNSLLNSLNSECKTPSTHFKLIKADNHRHSAASPSSNLFKYMFEDYDASLRGEIYSDAFGTATWRKFVGARAYSIVGWKGFIGAWRNFRKIPEESLLSVCKTISRPVLLSKGLELCVVKKCGREIRKFRKDARPAHQRMLEFKRLYDSNSFRWLNEEYSNKFGEIVTRKVGISFRDEKLEFRKFKKVEYQRPAHTRLLIIQSAFRLFFCSVVRHLK